MFKNFLQNISVKPKNQRLNETGLSGLDAEVDSSADQLFLDSITDDSDKHYCVDYYTNFEVVTNPNFNLETCSGGSQSSIYEDGLNDISFNGNEYYGQTMEIRTVKHSESLHQKRREKKLKSLVPANSSGGAKKKFVIDCHESVLQNPRPRSNSSSRKSASTSKTKPPSSKRIGDNKISLLDEEKHNKTQKELAVGKERKKSVSLAEKPENLLIKNKQKSHGDFEQNKTKTLKVCTNQNDKTKSIPYKLLDHDQTILKHKLKDTKANNDLNIKETSDKQENNYTITGLNPFNHTKSPPSLTAKVNEEIEAVTKVLRQVDENVKSVTRVRGTESEIQSLISDLKQTVLKCLYTKDARRTSVLRKMFLSNPTKFFNLQSACISDYSKHFGKESFSNTLSTKKFLSETTIPQILKFSMSDTKKNILKPSNSDICNNDVKNVKINENLLFSNKNREVLMMDAIKKTIKFDENKKYGTKNLVTPFCNNDTKRLQLKDEQTAKQIKDRNPSQGSIFKNKQRLKCGIPKPITPNNFNSDKKVDRKREESLDRKANKKKLIDKNNSDKIRDGNKVVKSESNNYKKKVSDIVSPNIKTERLRRGASLERKLKKNNSSESAKKQIGPLLSKNEEIRFSENLKKNKKPISASLILDNKPTEQKLHNTNSMRSSKQRTSSTSSRIPIPKNNRKSNSKNRTDVSAELRKSVSCTSKKSKVSCVDKKQIEKNKNDVKCSKNKKEEIVKTDTVCPKLCPTLKPKTKSNPLESSMSGISPILLQNQDVKSICQKDVSIPKLSEKLIKSIETQFNTKDNKEVNDKKYKAAQPAQTDLQIPAKLEVYMKRSKENVQENKNQLSDVQTEAHTPMKSCLKKRSNSEVQFENSNTNSNELVSNTSKGNLPCTKISYNRTNKTLISRKQNLVKESNSINYSNKGSKRNVNEGAYKKNFNEACNKKIPEDSTQNKNSLELQKKQEKSYVTKNIATEKEEQSDKSCGLNESTILINKNDQTDFKRANECIQVKVDQTLTKTQSTIYTADKNEVTTNMSSIGIETVETEKNILSKVKNSEQNTIHTVGKNEDKISQTHQNKCLLLQKAMKVETLCLEDRKAALNVKTENTQIDKELIGRIDKGLDRKSVHQLNKNYQIEIETKTPKNLFVEALQADFKPINAKNGLETIIQNKKDKKRVFESQSSKQSHKSRDTLDQNYYKLKIKIDNNVATLAVNKSILSVLSEKIEQDGYDISNEIDNFISCKRHDALGVEKRPFLDQEENELFKNTRSKKMLVLGNIENEIPIEKKVELEKEGNKTSKNNLLCLNNYIRHQNEIEINPNSSMSLDINKNSPNKFYLYETQNPQINNKSGDTLSSNICHLSLLDINTDSTFSIGDTPANKLPLVLVLKADNSDRELSKRNTYSVQHQLVDYSESEGEKDETLRSTYEEEITSDGGEVKAYHVNDFTVAKTIVEQNYYQNNLEELLKEELMNKNSEKVNIDVDSEIHQSVPAEPFLENKNAADLSKSKKEGTVVTASKKKSKKASRKSATEIESNRLKKNARFIRSSSKQSISSKLLKINWSDLNIPDWLTKQFEQNASEYSLNNNKETAIVNTSYENILPMNEDVLSYDIQINASTTTVMDKNAFIQDIQDEKYISDKKALETCERLLPNPTPRRKKIDITYTNPEEYVFTPKNATMDPLNMEQIYHELTLSTSVTQGSNFDMAPKVESLLEMAKHPELTFKISLKSLADKANQSIITLNKATSADKKFKKHNKNQVVDWGISSLAAVIREKKMESGDKESQPKQKKSLRELDEDDRMALQRAFESFSHKLNR